jgi:hypothetical protein
MARNALTRAFSEATTDPARLRIGLPDLVWLILTWDLAIAGGESRRSKAGNSTGLSRTRGSLRIPEKAVNSKRPGPGHYQGC